MNLINHSNESPGHPLASGRSARPARAETASIAMLGLAGIGMAALLMTASPTRPGGTPATQTGPVRHEAPSRFAADLRTAGAVVRYLLEAEPLLATNAGDPGAAHALLAGPTNAAAIGPRA